MILDVALLDVKHGEEAEFERAFSKAQEIIASINGYISHQLQRFIENELRYVLLVNWQTLENHTEGFRELAEYQQRK